MNGASRNLPQRIHLVGIGGIGLSAIARVLAEWGHEVSGSDLRPSPLLEELRREGITVYVGHAAEHVQGAQWVVVSSAVPEHNPEVQAALRAGIPVFKREHLLGAMMDGRCGLAVAGTHGKTTTTAMIAVILERLRREPTFIVGGIIAELGTNARAGRGPHFVIEADEYDRTFYGLRPQAAVVTNIEMDHPDCYRDLADLRAAFGTFLSGVAPEGAIVACADSPEVQRLLAEETASRPRVLTYGRSAGADYQVADVRPNARGGIDFTVQAQGRIWGRFSLALAGAHNALNATAALLVAAWVGVPKEEAAQVLADFRGVLRRFEFKGERRGVVVVDDYAHHPTQVRATLAAARGRYPERRIWAIFQPHTYSRTQTLLDEFATCFAAADRVIVTDIYAARAKEVPTISAQDLVAAMQHPQVQHIGRLDDVVAHLLAQVAPGDLVLTLGAGDGYLIGERLLAGLAEQER